MKRMEQSTCSRDFFAEDRSPWCRIDKDSDQANYCQTFDSDDSCSSAGNVWLTA